MVSRENNSLGLSPPSCPSDINEVFMLIRANPTLVGACCGEIKEACLLHRTFLNAATLSIGTIRVRIENTSVYHAFTTLVGYLSFPSSSATHIEVLTPVSYVILLKGDPRDR